ncbi:unnamed protein product [Urochloa decumbens]|uniref:F-box domain-containing protein n=1 Tax=Urochloa decumbens TaxID=240449 RepID=A0ABC8VES5_9POAL
MSPRHDAAAGRDRLSALPDDLLHLILRRLDAWQTVRDLSLLSRRWRRLWATSPFVTLTRSSHLERFGSNLLLRRDPSAPLRVFRLRTLCSYYCTHHEFQRQWLRDVMGRGGLRVLELQLRCSHEFRLPDCLFTCATLEEINLTASSSWKTISPKSVCLPRLKKLNLKEMLIDPSAVEKLNSGWPALEDLNLHRCWLGSFEVSSETLRTLSITDCTYTEIRVSAPNTASLKLTVSGKVNLSDMPSLVSVWMYISDGPPGYHLAPSCAYDLLAALSSAQRIELFRFELLPQDIVQKAAIEGLLFSNLKSLYVGEWLVTDFYNTLAFFIPRAPNLAALTLDQWKLYQRHNTDGDLSSSHVSRKRKPSTCDKLKLLPAVPRSLEMLLIRLSKGDDIEEFRKMRSVLKEKTKPRDTEVVVF